MSGNDPPSTVRRTFRGKSKGGCLTCRHRRVKCDEGKPQCLRCVRGGFACKGYALDVQPTGPLLLTRSYDSAFRFRGTSSISSPVSLSPTILEPRTPPPRIAFSRKDHQYYQLFCDKVARRLSGFIDTPIWGRIMLQACMDHEILRHVVVAIGALDMTLRTARSGAAFSIAVEHHQFALQKYSRAISIIRDEMSAGRQEFRTILLTTLLLFCFETLHGDFSVALTQIRHGINLLNNWITEKQSATPPTSGSPPSVHLSNWGVSKYYVGMNSPAPYEVEDELIQAFARLDIQLLCFEQADSSDDHDDASKVGTECIEQMPHEFSSVREAGAYNTLLTRRSLHFAYACLSPDFHQKLPQAAAPDFTSAGGLSKAMSGPAAEFIVGDKVKAGIMASIHHQKLWSSAFDPLYQKVLVSGDGQDYAFALLVKASNILTDVADKSTPHHDQMGFDKYSSQFREIVAICSVLLGLQGHYKGQEVPDFPIPIFTFDTGVIAPLYMTAVFCRDPEIRRQAIQLMLRRSWREGLWDSSSAGNIATLIMNIEEEAMVDGFIPSSARIRGTVIVQDGATRTAKVTNYLQAGYIEETVYWGQGVMSDDTSVMSRGKSTASWGANGDGKTHYLDRLQAHPDGTIQRAFRTHATFKNLVIR